MFKLVYIVSLLTNADSTVAALYFILFLTACIYCNVLQYSVKCNWHVLYPVGYNPLLDQMNKKKYEYEWMSAGIMWPKHDGDPLLSGTAKVSHVCRLTLPYPHTPYFVHLLQGLWHFCFVLITLYFCALFPVCELWKVRVYRK